MADDTLNIKVTMDARETAAGAQQAQAAVQSVAKAATPAAKESAKLQASLHGLASASSMCSGSLGGMVAGVVGMNRSLKGLGMAAGATGPIALAIAALASLGMLVKSLVDHAKNARQAIEDIGFDNAKMGADAAASAFGKMNDELDRQIKLSTGLADAGGQLSAAQQKQQLAAIELQKQRNIAGGMSESDAETQAARQRNQVNLGGDAASLSSRQAAINREQSDIAARREIAQQQKQDALDRAASLTRSGMSQSGGNYSVWNAWNPFATNLGKRAQNASRDNQAAQEQLKVAQQADAALKDLDIQEQMRKKKQEILDVEKQSLDLNKQTADAIARQTGEKKDAASEDKPEKRGIASAFQVPDVSWIRRIGGSAGAGVSGSADTAGTRRMITLQSSIDKNMQACREALESIKAQNSTKTVGGWA